MGQMTSLAYRYSLMKSGTNFLGRHSAIAPRDFAFTPDYTKHGVGNLIANPGERFLDEADDTFAIGREAHPADEKHPITRAIIRAGSTVINPRGDARKDANIVMRDFGDVSALRHEYRLEFSKRPVKGDTSHAIPEWNGRCPRLRRHVIRIDEAAAEIGMPQERGGDIFRRRLDSCFYHAAS
jgi:hypothetical protein